MIILPCLNELEERPRSRPAAPGIVRESGENEGIEAKLDLPEIPSVVPQNHVESTPQTGPEIFHMASDDDSAGGEHSDADDDFMPDFPIPKAESPANEDFEGAFATMTTGIDIVPEHLGEPGEKDGEVNSYEPTGVDEKCENVTGASQAFSFSGVSSIFKEEETSTEAEAFGNMHQSSSLPGEAEPAAADAPMAKEPFLEAAGEQSPKTIPSTMAPSTATEATTASTTAGDHAFDDVDNKAEACHDVHIYVKSLLAFCPVASYR